MSDSRDLLPISLVAHTVFCPRRAWLEAVGERVDSAAIERGLRDHRRVDSRRDERVASRRSVDVFDENLGLVGRCDVVEDRGDSVKVVEFKSAPTRGVAEVTPAQEIQLALQGVCLEAMGHTVTGHAVYFTTQRRSVEVPIDDVVRARAVEFVGLTRDLVVSPIAPAPLVSDPRCGRCSHAGVCLPDENREINPARAVSVRDPDGQVLHLATPGSRASMRAGRVVVHVSGEEIASLPVERVQGLVVHGNCDVSSALLRELLWRNVCIVWATFRGRAIGFARSTDSPNGGSRARQAGMPNEVVLPLACELIATKIANQATQLRRSSRQEAAQPVARLREMARRAQQAPDTRYLLGVEGDSAAIYFANFPNMLSRSKGQWFIERWPGRRGRGAGDPLNLALNMVYGALLSDMIRAVLSCGLDPHLGYVHSSSRNKPALALDLMEQFRPVVAESAVLTAVNNGELTPAMFLPVMGSWRLADSGRKALLAAYERRVEQTFRHPEFGYQVTWRRSMEVQARLVLSVIDGTQRRYRGIRTR